MAVNTLSSSYDTVLSVHDAGINGCPGDSGDTKACNNDCLAFLTSCVITPIVKGHDYLIRVSGFNGATGNLMLNIGQGTISGTVTDAATSAPLAGVTLYVIEDTDLTDIQATTDATGQYTLQGLPGGNFFVLAFKQDYVPQLYSGVACLGLCSSLSGTPISVTNGSDTPSIDFALNLGGSVSGTVTDALSSAPVANATVTINSIGSILFGSTGTDTTDSSGRYSITGLMAGSYFLQTSKTGYVNELFNNIPLKSTPSPFAGAPIAVILGSDTQIDVALDPGGTISGTVRDGISMLPVQDVFVTAFNEKNDFVSSGQTDASGAYSITGLPQGKYFVLTSSSFGYIDEIYDNIPCVNSRCDFSAGTQLTLAGSTMNMTGIDFNLFGGGSITGTVTDALSMSVLPFAFVQLFDSSGNQLLSGSASASGVYTFTGLPAGSYRLTADSSPSYVEELYDSFPCGQDDCDPTLGTPVPVAPPAQTANIDFALSPGGSISGTVFSPIIPLEDIEVAVLDTSGNELATDETDASGKYSIGGLSTGDYYVSATDSKFFTAKPSFIGKVYNNHVCPGPLCNPLISGDLVHVNTGIDTPNINFTLIAGARMQGKISETTGGGPVPFGAVSIKDASGNVVSFAISDGAGTYLSLYGLPTGSYYSQTGFPGLSFIAPQPSPGLIDELFDNILCPKFLCDPLSGTPVSLTLPSITSGIDFALGSCSGVDIQPPALPDASPGINYNQSLTSTGTAPLSFTITGGVLPPGLSVSAAGVISGAPSTQGIYNITITVEDANGCVRSRNYNVNVTLPYLLFDDFEDSIFDWDSKKGSWSESGGAMQGTGSATALAYGPLPWSPSGVSGCSVCTIEVDMETAGDPFNKTFLEAWYVNNGTRVELLMKEASNKWVLKEKSGGAVVAKQKASLTIDPGVNYHVKLSFDGSAFQLFIDNNPAITMPAGAAVPAGNVGFKIKNTTSIFRQIFVY